MTTFADAMQVRDYLASHGLRASHIEVQPGKLVRFEFTKLAPQYITLTMRAMTHTELLCYICQYVEAPNGSGVLTYWRGD